MDEENGDIAFWLDVLCGLGDIKRVEDKYSTVVEEPEVGCDATPKNDNSSAEPAEYTQPRSDEEYHRDGLAIP